ncbi:MAG: hypothetical protein R6V00_05155 [Candidatus Aminicenantes bacterium]
MNGIKNHFKIFIINSVIFLSILYLLNCAAPHMENIYELGVSAPLITLSYEGGSKVDVTRTCEAIVVNYKVNRPVKDFIKHLQSRGKIKCMMNIANIIRVEDGWHDSPKSGGLTFNLRSLDENGVLRPKLCHSKKDFNSPAEGTVSYYIIAVYYDHNGHKHKGLISNYLTIPASFYDR